MTTRHALRPHAQDTPGLWLEGSLGKALQLVELLKDHAPATIDEARLVELEAEFQSGSEALQSTGGNGRRQPFYWNELVDASESIRSVFQLMLIYAAWRRTLATRRSFRPFLEAQGRMLENALELARQCLGNGECCRELLRSNQLELEELKRLCDRGIATIGAEGRTAQQALRLLELFAELAAADTEFLDCLEELYATNGL